MEKKPLIWSLRAGRESPRPPRKDVLSRPVFMLCDTAEQARVCLDDLGRPVAGLILIPGLPRKLQRIGEHLWLLRASAEEERHLLAMTDLLAALLNIIEEESNHYGRTQKELEHVQQDLHLARMDYSATVEYLIKRAQEAGELSRHLIDLEMEERVSLARDLHDDLGQYISSLRIKSFMIQSDLREAGSPLAAEMDTVLKQADGMNQLIRGWVRRLYPVRSKGEDLMKMLYRLTEDMAASYGIEVAWTRPERAPSVTGLVAEQLLYIAQEAMRNAIRHGQARRIRTKLSRTRNGRVCLDVQNDGLPFVVPHNSDGMGLAIMKQRALLLGGELEIAARPGGGTRVTCCCPMTLEAPSDEARRQTAPREQE